MERRSKIPNREWLGVVFPAAYALILLGAAFTNAAGRLHGWIVVLTCFVAGATLPLSYSVVLLRERRLYLRSEADIERNGERIAAGRTVGWLLGACFLAAGVSLGGLSRVVLLAALAGRRWWGNRCPSSMSRAAVEISPAVSERSHRAS